MNPSRALIIATPETFLKRRVGQLLSLIDRYRLDIYDLYSVCATSEDLYEFFELVGDIPDARAVEALLEGKILVVGVQTADALAMVGFKSILPESNGLSKTKFYDATNSKISEFWFGKS